MTDFEPIISDKAKTVAYFVTDILGIVSSFLAAILAILNIVDGVAAVSINAAVIAALTGLKQTFRLSNKKQ